MTSDPAKSEDSPTLTAWGTRGPPWRARDESEPSKQFAPFPSLEASLGAAAPSGFGELPGVRSTIDDLVAQEVRGGCPVEVAQRQVRRLAVDYDRSVRTGETVYPIRRD
jgi:hypothetical protein